MSNLLKIYYAIATIAKKVEFLYLDNLSQPVTHSEEQAGYNSHRAQITRIFKVDSKQAQHDPSLTALP